MINRMMIFILFYNSSGPTWLSNKNHTHREDFDRNVAHSIASMMGRKGLFSKVIRLKNGKLLFLTIGLLDKTYELENLH